MQTAFASAVPATRLESPPCAVSLVIFSAIDAVWHAEDVASLEAARWLVTQRVPLVILSQAPAARVLELQAKLGMRHPFVSEGGGALWVPVGYFPELTRMGQLQNGWNIVDFKAPHGSGAAVRLLISLFRLCSERIVTVGLGSTLEDRALLRLVDVPVVVRGNLAEQATLLQEVPSAYLTGAPGVSGWTETILGSLAE